MTGIPSDGCSDKASAARERYAGKKRREEKRGRQAYEVAQWERVERSDQGYGGMDGEHFHAFMTITNYILFVFIIPSSLPNPNPNTTV